MYINEIKIKNFKYFKNFKLDFNPDMNILVGDNEAGKSTILQAIHLALTGYLDGQYLKHSLSSYLFNEESEKEYIKSLKSGIMKIPPSIEIELFFSGKDIPEFEGDNNSYHVKNCGLIYKIEFDNGFNGEYEELIKNKKTDIKTIPIEYYKVSWESFARDYNITSKSIPIKSALIDSSTFRFQNGSDIYISMIINNNLEETEKVMISQTYREIKENFMEKKCIDTINEKINEGIDIGSDKKIKISVDRSTRSSWEKNLMTYLNNIPFHQIGKGEQCIIKTHLALNHKKTKEKNVILLEEPENHLSYSRMNRLIHQIQANSKNKQIIISTHNSFVANKLGLEKLCLLHQQVSTKFTSLSPDTKDFFKKLAGYDTLRLLLCKKAILVEGPSDELIVQKAYKDKYNKLPIEDRIDVISVGLSFLRFLEIAKELDIEVFIVTDNDKNYKKNIEQKYKDYLDNEKMIFCYSENNELNTLEPHIVEVNQRQLKTLCTIFEIPNIKYDTKQKIVEYMTNNKTECALKIFDAKEKISFPEYIMKAINRCSLTIKEE